MAKHLHELIDEIFDKNFYKHRTLRTVFDIGSSEWKETSIEEKLEILRKIKQSGKISMENLILQYKIYYLMEVKNKSHVVESLEESLAILLGEAINH